METWVNYLAEAGIKLDEHMPERVEYFLNDLYDQNTVMNLTRVPREEAFTRHILDSLLFLDLIPEESEVLDLGTGAGFPAWPIALARPDVTVTALDSNGKMIGFLRRHQTFNMKIVQERIETWPVREAFDVVTGRALAPLAIQMEVSAGPLVIGGHFIPMRTPGDLGVIPPVVAESLGLALVAEHERPLPGTDVVRYFPVYRKVKATPERFPRSWAEIRRRPLA